MPGGQETVSVITGSALLWRITPRPAHSEEVTHTHTQGAIRDMVFLLCT